MFQKLFPLNKLSLELNAKNLSDCIRVDGWSDDSGDDDRKRLERTHRE